MISSILNNDSFVKIGSLLLGVALIGSNAVSLWGLPLYIWYRILAVVCLPLLTVVWWRDWLGTRDKLLKGYVSFAVWWLLYGVVSLLWSPDCSFSVKYLVYLAAGLLLSLVAVSWTIRSVRAATRVLLGVYVVGLIVGVFESLGMLRIHLTTCPEFEAVGAFSLFGYNEFAFVCCVIFPFVINYLNSRAPCITWMVSAATVWCLLNTASVIGIVVTCSEIVFQLFGRLRTSKWYRIVIIIVVILSVSVISVRHLKDRIVKQYVNVITSWQQNEIYTSDRLELLFFDLRLVYDSALLGVGPGGDTYHILKEGGPGNSHNWFMEVLTNFGLPVFAPYILLWALTLRRLWKIYAQSIGCAKDITYSALTVQFFLPIMGMMSSTLLRQNSFWVITGVILGLALKGSEQV